MQIRAITLGAALLMVSGSLALAQGNRPEGAGGGQGPGAAQGAQQGSPGRGPGDRAAPGQAEGQKAAPDRREAQSPKGPAERSDRANERASGPKDAQKGDADQKRQARDKDGADQKRQARDKDDARDKQKAAGKKDEPDADRRAEPGKGTTKDGRQAGTGGDRVERVVENDQQRQRVREGFRSERSRGRHYTNVNINIEVGRRLPRDWSYRPVPQFVVEIVPRYRGYRYVWVEERYVIVHPTTYEIVAYVDDDTGYVYAAAGGGSATGAAGGESGRNVCTIDLEVAERRRFVEIINWRGPRVREVLSIGASVPADIELEVLPEDIRTRYDQLESCRYVLLPENRIAIVEPRSRRVVTVISQ
jgi:hypothetical protein